MTTTVLRRWPGATASAKLRPITTFSLVARDPINGDLGVAVASKFLAVGSVVPFLQAEIGAVATQSYANTSFGPRAIAMMQAGEALATIEQEFSATDPKIAQRQYGLVAANGAALSFTGSGCHDWAGGVTGPGFAAQGNLLTGPAVVAALAETFVASTSSGDSLATRLLAALLAADRAGGDKRGRQSAALVVVRAGGGYGGWNDRLLDLRVDDNHDPVVELGRLLQIHRLLFERPQDRDLLALTGETWQRLRTALERAGHALGPDWDAEAEAALASVAGNENLEERLVEPARLGHPAIDRAVLHYLEARFVISEPVTNEPVTSEPVTSEPVTSEPAEISEARA
jgi:uncharacterized Ntn-hydrolase superfamily protein